MKSKTAPPLRSRIPSELSDDEVRAIRQADGRPHREIADEYGLTPGSVGLIRSGKARRDVTDDAPTAPAAATPVAAIPKPAAAPIKVTVCPPMAAAGHKRPPSRVRMLPIPDDRRTKPTPTAAVRHIEIPDVRAHQQPAEDDWLLSGI